MAYPGVSVESNESPVVGVASVERASLTLPLGGAVGEGNGATV